MFCMLFAKSIQAQIFSVNSPDSILVLQYLAQAQKTSNVDSSRHFLEDAFNLSRQLNFGEGLHQSLYQLSEFEEEEGNLTMALRYALQAMNHYEKEKHTKKIFDLFLHVGGIYQNENLQTKAKDYFLKAHQLMGIATETEDTVRVYQLLANTYTQLSEIDSAIFYYQKMVDFHEGKNDNDHLIRTYQDMATTYTVDSQYAQSLDYNYKILDLLKEKENPVQLAVLYNNIGYSYNDLKLYRKAIEFFTKTEKICRQKAYVDMPVLFTNIGITYNNNGQPQRAINYLLKASELIRTAFGEGPELANIDNLLATIYMANEDYYNAMNYNEGAMRMVLGGDFNELLGETYNTAAQIYQKLYDYEKALEYLKKYRRLRDSFLLEERLRQQDLLQQQLLLERAEKEIKLLIVQQDVQDLRIGQLELEKDKFQLESENFKLASKTHKDEVALLLREQEIRKANLQNKELEAERAQQEVKLIEQRLNAEKKDRALLILRQEEKVKELAQLNLERDNDILTRDKDILVKDKALLIEKQEVNRLELEQQRNFRQFVYGLGGLLFLILTMILSGLFYFKTANQRLAEKNSQIELQKKEIEKSHNEVEEQRQKSEDLLLNILPEQTVAELKESGVATPRDYEKVTVIFTDFTGFTEIAEKMAPQDLITELNICFRAFDEILEKHNLEKIKTLGDGYMCAGGVPTPNETNPEDAVSAALEMSAYIAQRKKEKEADRIPYWDMRIGIHTGHVIAGVVGKKRFAYDIWGDTVNLASRLETSGEDGKINISETTFELVKNKFNCQHRGAIEVKHKGKVDMYFVDNKK